MRYRQEVQGSGLRAQGNSVNVFTQSPQPPALSQLRVAVVTAAMLLGAAPAWASVTLSVRVVRGGFDLDFGRVEPGQAANTEELELTLSSTGTAQYRLYQEARGFLVNERGLRLPDGVLLLQISRGMAGSPTTGGMLPVTDTPQELYVSSSSGSSDTLLLVYSVAAKPDLPAGTYRGVLRFTVESQDTGAIVTHTINVRLSVAEIVQLEPPAGGVSRLLLGSVGPGERSETVALPIAFRNNAAGAVSLLQEPVDGLSSPEGASLPPDALMFTVSSAQGSPAWRPVANHPERVLEDPRGELRQCTLSYAASLPMDQRAGRYRGMVRLRLIGPEGSTKDEWLLPVELEVPEVFTVSVSIPDGAEAMHFSRPASGSGVVQHTMKITVTTNMGKPYQVLGGLDHPLVLPTGEALPAAALSWSVAEPSRGKPLIAPESPVAIGLEPVYQSDSSGSSVAFLLHYRMDIPLDARNGVYAGQIHFSVTMF
ncbi:MAG: hypothetical protein HY598_03655 [Candidatus Omnitrophica bacterium]|nr:hypothetical protein [Candidatus Omnitrophota bacterium]